MLDLLLEIVSYFKARKRIWLLPIAVFLVLLGTIVFIATKSAFGPFVYTLF